MCPTDAYKNMLSKKNTKIPVLIVFYLKAANANRIKDGSSRMKQLDILILNIDKYVKKNRFIFSTEDGTGYGYGWKVSENIWSNNTLPMPCFDQSCWCSISVFFCVVSFIANLVS